MIIGIIHSGSGLGDQLFSYIATRVRAADLGVDFGFVGKEFFKGASFMNLDWGKETNLHYEVEANTGAVKVFNVVGIPGKATYYPIYKLNKPCYDPEFNFIPDGSIIDGYGAQDIRYFEHRLDEVSKWLEVPWLNIARDLCIINFRGGEFAVFPELFLTKEYWDQAIKLMQEKYPGIRFEVHTDDPVLAQQFFPQFIIYQDIALNWSSIRWAKYLIISNSAFAVMPSLLNKNVEEVIAPRYWARRNLQQWSTPQNYYKKFTYI